MGLFSKKVCSFCNKPLGMLDSALSTKLADGHILGNCCSKLVSHYAYCIPLTSLTKDQVLEHINQLSWLTMFHIFQMEKAILFR